MDNVGFGEVLVILLVGLIVLGPTKLPQAVRQVAHFIGEIRRMSISFKQELYDAVEEPIRESKATLAAADPRHTMNSGAYRSIDVEGGQTPPEVAGTNIAAANSERSGGEV